MTSSNFDDLESYPEMPAGPLWQLTIRLDYRAVDAAVNLLEDEGFLGLSWMECPDAPPSEETDDNGFPIASVFQIDAYSDNEPDVKRLKGAIESVLEISTQKVDDTDWLEACYVGMPAQTYGHFYVYGSHIKDVPPVDLIPVRVDAATAFGSGDHPTTAGCLKMLSTIVDKTNDEGRQIRTILDMGCGSGILGIAAKKSMPRATVVMVDNDSESVRVTGVNAQINETEVIAIESEGFADDRVAQYAPYDLILANILAKPLCMLASDFSRTLMSGGYIIVSGLLSRHVDLIKENYQPVGLNLVDQLLIEDWATLVFQKQ